MLESNTISVQFYIHFKIDMRCVQSYANTWYSSNFVNQVLCFNCQRSLILIKFWVYNFTYSFLFFFIRKQIFWNKWNILLLSVKFSYPWIKMTVFTLNFICPKEKLNHHFIRFIIAKNAYIFFFFNRVNYEKSAYKNHIVWLKQTISNAYI